jgi:hypothetical protein
VPLCALALADPEELTEIPLARNTPTGLDPPRLLEAAVLRFAPSAAFVRELSRRRRRGKRTELQLALAVCDPTDDLKYARVPPAGARRLLLGERGLAEHGNRSADRGLATSEELSRSLRDNPREDAVFYFSGHASQGPPGRPAEAALELARGERLSAAKLIEERGRYPLPARVLLAACGSSGSDAAGTAEWLGLGPACLWAGAETVVATAWQVLDHPITNFLDHELAHALCREADTGHALRSLQLDQLHRWRCWEDPDPLGPDFHPPDHPDFRPPLFWAAYLALGFASAQG